MKQFIIVMTLLIGLQSCKNDSADEMKVLIEIFDDLIDTMGVLSEFLIPPPPSIPFFDYNNNVMVYDAVEHQKVIDEIEIKNKKMRDTTFVIAVFDTLFTCYDKNLNVSHIQSQLTEKGYIEALKATENQLIISRPLDLSKIKNRERFTLKYLSEFPEGMKIWERENYDFLFSGVLAISRIYFDPTGQFGIFDCSYTCGRLCGEGVIICIRKINDKWIIEKTILLSVS